MKANINEMDINGVIYVPKDSIKEEVINWTGEESIASRMIGKPVIVRSRNEGINIGIVVLADNSGIELKNARRLYYHKPLDKNLSWYEGVAESGLSENSKVSGTVKVKTIIEDYSMTECSVNIYESILKFTPNGNS